IASLGSTDQHSQIQLYNEGPNDLIVTFIFGEIFETDPQIKTEIKEFEYLNGKGFKELISIEREATALSLRENQRSNGTIMLDSLSPRTMGGLFYFFEL
ncbi:MAG: glucose-6-phosphate isomerase, partial [Patescibacteria group bacterium]